jgi:dTDP-glucose 4,6-dehydratase
MRYVITGGAGFIGSNFIRCLLKDDSQTAILNIDKMTYAANKLVHDEFSIFTNYEYVIADICNYESIYNIVQPDDIVVNFAAESHVDRSIDSQDVFVQTNIVGVNNLLQICRERMLHNFCKYQLTKFMDL